jgi:hypothetical protein
MARTVRCSPSERHATDGTTLASNGRERTDIEEQIIGGVGTQIVAPKSGVSADNCTRVLSNLHGGGFVLGAGLGGSAESIPVSAVGRFKVISIDYRQAPEHSFPAASEDVASVFTELLKQYPAKNIGIYGSSAGGILTAMTVAWLQKKKLPARRFDGPPSEPNTWGGDSRFTAPPLVGQMPSPVSGVPATWSLQSKMRTSRMHPTRHSGSCRAMGYTYCGQKSSGRSAAGIFC